MCFPVHRVILAAVAVAVDALAALLGSDIIFFFKCIFRYILMYLKVSTCKVHLAFCYLNLISLRYYYHCPQGQPY